MSVVPAPADSRLDPQNPACIPTFSIVVPAHSRPVHLARCLEAIAALDYPGDRFEVVVVDDGSEAPLQDAVEPFRRRVAIETVRQSNRGPAAARNAGAAVAGGSFLAFTDDDCLPASGWLKAFARQFDAGDDQLVVGGQTINGLVDNACSASSQMIQDAVYEYYNQQAQQPLFFASNNLSLSAARFRQAGGFNETFRTSEDRELCNRLAHQGRRLVYAPEARVLHDHAMTLVSLCQQHFQYGRGAFRFHALCMRRGTGRLQPDLEFYKRLLLRPFAERPFGRALRLIGPIVLAQAANVAGVLYEGLCPGTPRRT